MCVCVYACQMGKCVLTHTAADSIYKARRLGLKIYTYTNTVVYVCMHVLLWQAGMVDKSFRKVPFTVHVNAVCHISSGLHDEIYNTISCISCNTASQIVIYKVIQKC